MEYHRSKSDGMLSRHPFSLASLQHTLDIFPSYFAAVSETYHIDFEMDITSHRKDGNYRKISTMTISGCPKNFLADFTVSDNFFRLK